MKIKNISESSPFDPSRYVAEEFLEGHQSNVRMIKLAPGTTLPPHRHGQSDLMLFVISGSPRLDTESGPRELGQGDMVFVSPDEELRVSNNGEVGVVLLAFLSPPFPPRST